MKNKYEFLAHYFSCGQQFPVISCSLYNRNRTFVFVCKYKESLNYSKLTNP